jgi:hypothetical protein
MVWIGTGILVTVVFSWKEEAWEVLIPEDLNWAGE